MYEKIRISPQRKHDKLLRMIIAAVMISFAVLAVTVIWFMGYFSRYQRFVGKLSDSTVYAYDNRCLRAEVDGQSLWVNLKNDYNIYTHITVYGIGAEKHALPESAPDVFLDYGNGSSLSLWDVEPAGGGRAHKLFIHYEDQTGYSYSYTTDELDLETLKVKYLLVKTNRPWEE